MNKLFDTSISQNNVTTFLEVARNMSLSKLLLSILAYIAKNEKRLVVSNLKEWLIMDYEGNEENGVYSFKNSSVLNKLEGLNFENRKLEQFPEVPIFNDSEWLDVNKVQAGLMVDAYTFISDDPTRYFMNGISFDDSNAIATDGRRMFYSYDKGFGKYPKVIMPYGKCLLWLLKKGNEIQYKIEKTYSVFKFKYKNEQFYYFIQNINGQFPNWKRVIPENKKQLGLPDIKEWKEIYKKCMALSERGQYRIKIKPNSDMVDIWTGPVSGDDILLGAIQWPGFTGELWINYQYLNDALMLPGLVRIKYTDMVKGLTFEYKNGSTVIVMPMSKDDK